MLWLEHAPLWIIGLILLVVLGLSQQIGFAVGRLAIRKTSAADEREGTSYLLSAVLALLGLLIAFTFSSAESRFDARRHLMVDEANAISTTYLRMQALDDGVRAELGGQMIRYVQVREAFFDAGEDQARLDTVYAQTELLQRLIWTSTMKAVRAQPTASINVPLLQATNTMFDLAESERTALEARVPITIIRSLLFYFVVVAAIIGYALAPGGRHLVGFGALFVALALAFALILDLDRPRSGHIQIGHAPLLRVAASIQAMEAERLSSPATP